MRIIKFPKNPQEVIKPIKVKCTCGCKVVLEDINDLIYLRGIDFATPRITYGWLCPYCTAEHELPENVCTRISNHLNNHGVNLHEYLNICDTIQYHIPLHTAEHPLEFYIRTLEQMQVPLPQSL